MVRCDPNAFMGSAVKEGYEVFSVGSVPEANAKLRGCTNCIRELNIEGHGRGAGMWVGSDRQPDNYFTAIPKPDGGYEFHNVEAMFGHITFCKGCTIYLRGCAVAKQDGWPELKQKIETLTGCKVLAFARDCYAGRGGRGLSGP